MQNIHFRAMKLSKCCRKSLSLMAVQKFSLLKFDLLLTCTDNMVIILRYMILQFITVDLMCNTSVF